MNKIKVTYLDWIITATCRKHSPHDVSGPGRYTGHAIAVLGDFDNDRGWSDTRPMTTDIVSEVCASSDGCLAALVAGAKARVDALGKRAPIPAMFSVRSSAGAIHIPSLRR